MVKARTFEKKSSYSITIVATSVGTTDDTNDADDPDRGSKYGRLGVTIKVVDGETRVR